MESHKKAMKRLFLGVTFVALYALLFTPASKAQTDSLPNQLNVALNFTTHGEVCGGGLPRTSEKTELAERHSSFLFGRTRLVVGYNRTGLEANAVLQNSAIWGMKGNQTLGLYEGWVKMTARNGLFAQVGRVALTYDDERIIGTNDFATAALSHDVLRVGYEGHGHKVHAFFAYNQNGENQYSSSYYVNGAQLYKTMQTVWYHYDVPKFPLGVSLLFMNIGQQAGEKDNIYNPPTTKYEQVWGGYVSYHPEHLTLEGSYYRQSGKIVDEFMQAGSVKAWMASAKATIKPSERYGFELGYDYLSGDDYIPVTYGGMFGVSHHGAQKGFSPLYGSRAKFYGIMDYFYESAYINGFTPGLQNAFVGGYVRPTDKLQCRATYHYLAVATNLKDLDRTLGHSIDLQASYRFSKDIVLVAGYTQMSGTETMERLKQGNGDKQARWGWFSLVVSPSLFSTKW
ncbi:MAG: hypothetical protein IK092_01515 [Muribaculaceae bacterium]|nr:hypothetical protein [Muribaculaceae bacterium]